MADSAQNLLASYFRYQRDIGVDDIVFGFGSEVAKILSEAGAKKTANAGFSEPRAVVAPQNTLPIKTTLQSIPTRTTIPAGPAQPVKQSSGPAVPPRVNEGAGDKAGAAVPDAFARLSMIKKVDPAAAAKFERKPLSSAPAVQSAKREKLAEFYHETVKCDKCEAAHNRSKVVFGSGSADGRLFVVGCSPDVAEDSAGLPFRGTDGELFDKILGKMGLDRKEGVFASYIQKCRAGGFDPGYAGVCREILDRQIEIIAPKAILVFGQPAANFLFGNDDAIEQLRAINHIYKGVPAVVTYSLSLMSKETQFRFGAWDDMKKIMGMIG